MAKTNHGVAWPAHAAASHCPRLHHPQAYAPSRRLPVAARAQQSDGGGGGGGLVGMLRQIQASLPIVGLVTRLTSVAGGVGRDELQYPEFSRAVYEAAPEGFQIAVADLQQRHGKAAQRRNVLLVLWMARQGAGLLPAKAIVDAGRRLRVSQDLEYEVERFNLAFEGEAGKYTYVERPRGSQQLQADVAVDALARLCAGLKDGEPLPAEDAALVEAVVLGGFGGTLTAETVRQSIAERPQRASAYA